jgi:superfamily I DNA/RNA helicase
MTAENVPIRMAEQNTLWVPLVQMIRAGKNLVKGTKKLIDEWEPGGENFDWGYLLERHVIDAVERGDLEWLKKNVTKVYEKQVTYAATLIKKHGIYMLERKPKIIVGTIHSVKGGEADVVIVSPDISKAAAVDAQEHGQPSVDALVRAFYVAFTRAREKLVILDPATKMFMDLPR